MFAMFARKCGQVDRGSLVRRSTSARIRIRLPVFRSAQSRLARIPSGRSHHAIPRSIENRFEGWRGGFCTIDANIHSFVANVYQTAQLCLGNPLGPIPQWTRHHLPSTCRSRPWIECPGSFVASEYLGKGRGWEVGFDRPPEMLRACKGESKRRSGWERQFCKG